MKNKHFIWLSIILLCMIVLFCLNPLLLKSNSKAHTDLAKNNLLQPKKINKEKSYLSIPFSFLPNYKIQKNRNNQSILINEEGKDTLVVPTNEIAIVLIDTWNSFDNNKNSKYVECMQNIQQLLLKCRKNKITVIHAPNHPVVDKYPQYHAIKKEVKNYINKHSTTYTPDSTFLEWPQENEFNTTIAKSRKNGRSGEYIVKPQEERDVSKRLTPLANEYVLASYEEFRYVLWKEKIKVILYVGGSLNECMLQRDTGINLLAGSDSRRSNFSIVVVEDCSFVMTNPNTSYEATKQAMLNYYKRKIAVVSNSQAMNFH